MENLVFSKGELGIETTNKFKPATNPTTSET